MLLCVDVGLFEYLELLKNVRQEVHELAKKKLQGKKQTQQERDKGCNQPCGKVVVTTACSVCTIVVIRAQ